MRLSSSRFAPLIKQPVQRDCIAYISRCFIEKDGKRTDKVLQIKLIQRRMKLEMRHIEYYSRETRTAYFGIYKQILAHYIDKVMRAIKETDKGIKWYICSEDDLPDNPKSKWALRTQKLTGFVVDAQYGRSKIDTKEIWISTYAIRYAPFPDLDGISVFTKRRRYNQLVEVIIDEFTHIKTKKDHGDSEYDRLKNDYMQRYFLGPSSFFSRIQWQLRN